MVYISELFPNPAGSDTGNEWIELCNNGVSSQSLAGWRLQDASLKSFVIDDVTLPPQSCVVFYNAQTKVSLNNNTETISLFDVSGVLVDTVSYNKAVKDNQALARASAMGELQTTIVPTKGKIQNVILAPVTRTKSKASTPLNTLVNTEHGVGSMEQGIQNGTQTQALTLGTNIFEVIVIGACVAGILATVFVKVAITLRATDKS